MRKRVKHELWDERVGPHVLRFRSKQEFLDFLWWRDGNPVEVCCRISPFLFVRQTFRVGFAVWVKAQKSAGGKCVLGSPRLVLGGGEGGVGRR